MTRALVLRHHLEDHSGLIGEAFESRGYEIDLRMMNEDSATPSLDGYDVFVILGSKSAVYDKEVEQAWFGREIDLIAEAERRDIPVFGICFGAQALCLYHGGIVERSNEPEIGWYDVEARNDSTTVCCPRVPNCGRPHRARSRPFALDATWACSSIRKSTTFNSETGSPAASKRRATLASMSTPSSNGRNSKRPRPANARPTSSTSSWRTSRTNSRLDDGPFGRN
jgi:hypothetical protein